jgi:hypothetical protein
VWFNIFVIIDHLNGWNRAEAETETETETKVEPEIETKTRIGPETQREKTKNQTNQSNTNKLPKRISFDARKLLQTYGNIDIGECKIESLHLSQRGAVDSNGYYHCVNEIRFP